MMLRSWLMGALLVATAMSCGKKKDDNNNNDTSSIYGQWAGTHRVRDNSGDGKYSSTTVTLVLNRDDTFNIRDNKLDLMASGDFEYSERKRLLTLYVTESNFASFGLKSKHYAYYYTIEADRLQLGYDDINSNTSASLSLTREKGADSLRGRSFDGQWHCKDDRGGVWGIQITDGQANIVVTHKGPAIRMVADVHVAAGQAGRDEPLKAEFVIASSTPPTSLLRLDVVANGGGETTHMDLTPVYREGSAGGGVQAVSCAI